MSVIEKAEASEVDRISDVDAHRRSHGHDHDGLTEREEIGRIDAMADAPGVTMESFAHLDEKKILRKMDMRLIPMLALLYLLSFLDRKYAVERGTPSAHQKDSEYSLCAPGGNIGNAKIEGLQEDLNMTSDQYNWCLTVFFFSYAAFEVPSNLLLKKLRPSRWLPLIMVAWGTVMTLMGIVRSYSGLLAARFFLGVAEAGLFPGCAVSDRSCSRSWLLEID